MYLRCGRYLRSVIVASAIVLAGCGSKGGHLDTMSFDQRISVIADLQDLVRGGASLQNSDNAAQVEFLSARLALVGHDLLPVTRNLTAQLRESPRGQLSQEPSLMLALGLNRVFSYELNDNLLLDDGDLLWENYGRLLAQSRCPYQSGQVAGQLSGQIAGGECGLVNEARDRFRQFAVESLSGTFYLTGAVAPRGNLVWQHRSIETSDGPVTYSYTLLPIYRPWMVRGVLESVARQAKLDRYYVGSVALVCLPHPDDQGLPPCLRRGSQISRSRLAGYTLLPFYPGSERVKRARDAGQTAASEGTPAASVTRGRQPSAS